MNKALCISALALLLVFESNAGSIQKMELTTDNAEETIQWDGETTSINSLRLKPCDIVIRASESQESVSYIDVDEFTVSFKEAIIHQEKDNCVIKFSDAADIEHRE